MCILSQGSYVYPQCFSICISCFHRKQPSTWWTRLLSCICIAFCAKWGHGWQWRSASLLPAAWALRNMGSRCYYKIKKTWRAYALFALLSIEFILEWNLAVAFLFSPWVLPFHKGCKPAFCFFWQCNAMVLFPPSLGIVLRDRRISHQWKDQRKYWNT